MRLSTTAVLLVVLAGAPAFAQSERLQGGPVSLRHLDDTRAQVDAIYREILPRVRGQGLKMRMVAPAASEPPHLEFPLRLRPSSKNIRANGIGFFIDHDPRPGANAIEDYMCGQRTYDGHSGVDFVPFPFWWRMMDNDEAEVVAAAPGRIVSKHDGEFDRQCHFDIATANVVAVQQDDGLTAYYFHLKKGSLTKAAVGSRVATGDFIGMVGSSGVSYVPHLHFELRDGRNAVVEPYFGACSRNQTLWKQQTEDFDSDVLRVAAQTSAPKISPGDFCSDPDPDYSDTFKPGSTVFAVAYLRDMQAHSPVTVSIVAPDGTVLGTGTSGSDSLVDRMSFYYISRKLPKKPTGRWLVRAELDGKTYEHAFMVGSKPKKPTAVQALVQPLARSVKTDDVAVFDVSVQNTGKVQALGCTLAPDAPLAAVWHYQPVVNGEPAGSLDQAFDLDAGATAQFQLTFAPKAGFVAYGSAVPVRTVCNNADGADEVPGFNVLTLSFADDTTPDIVTEMVSRLTDKSVVVLQRGKTKVKFQATDLGAAGAITARVKAAESVPVSVQICRMQGSQCVEGPADSVSVNFDAGGSESFRIDIKPRGDVPFDVVQNRVIVEFVDALDITRGAMSMAVTTENPPAGMASAAP